MKSEPELAAAANANFLGSFRKLAEHGPDGQVREEEGVFAFVTGHPVSLFNGCVVTASTPSRELEDSIGWVRERALPYRVWVAEELVDSLAGALQRAGLEVGPDPYPNMILHPSPDAPAPPDDVRVVAMAGSEVGDFVAASVDVGLPLELAERIFTPSFVGDGDVQAYVGLLAGRPAGTALAIRTGDVSGVYNVGVATSARRRGLGTALTWAAVQAGRAWGCEPIVLQSTAMAYSMYEAMGFRTLGRFSVFGESRASLSRT
jgi:ribosomal protein S18 acetylase RimI-like enzyme